MRQAGKGDEEKKGRDSLDTTRRNLKQSRYNNTPKANKGINAREIDKQLRMLHFSVGVGGKGGENKVWG
jgi:hypothetical protein